MQRFIGYQKKELDNRKVSGRAGLERYLSSSLLWKVVIDAVKGELQNFCLLEERYAILEKTYNDVQK